MPILILSLELFVERDNRMPEPSDKQALKGDDLEIIGSKILLIVSSPGLNAQKLALALKNQFPSAPIITSGVLCCRYDEVTKPVMLAVFNNLPKKYSAYRNKIDAVTILIPELVEMTKQE